MRVTHGSTSRNLLAEIQRNMQRIDEAQASIVTGRRIRAVSDDPVSSATVMRASSELRALEQYRRNVVSAEMRLAAEEHALDRLSDILVRTREIALSQAGATASEMTRATALAEVDRLIDAVTELGNTKVTGGFLFGGDATDRAPFESPGILAEGISGTPGVEISAGNVVAVTHNARQVFEASGVLAALHALRDGLAGNDAGAIAQSAAELTHAFEEVQYLLGEVGARSNQLAMAGENVDALEAELRIQRSQLEEVDLEAAILELASRQAALQAAMLATSQMLHLRLTEYLR